MYVAVYYAQNKLQIVKLQYVKQKAILTDHSTTITGIAHLIESSWQQYELDDNNSHIQSLSYCVDISYNTKLGADINS